MRRLHVWAAAAVAALVVLLAGWLVLAPGWAVTVLRDKVQAELGRQLEVAGGAHLEVSPRLAIRFDGVKLANPAEPGESFVSAASLAIPVSLSDLFSHRINISELWVDTPDIGFVVNERGEASWAFPTPKTPAALRLVLQDAAIRYFDVRSGQGFAFGGANLSATISPDGEVTLAGTARINGRFADIAAHAASLSRIHEDGSPFDLAFSVPELAIQFNGRLATAHILSLAGTGTLSAGNVHSAAQWMGVTPERAAAPLALAMSGAMEAAGQTFAMRHADIAIGTMSAKGNVSLDSRGEVPALQADLAAPAIDLAAILPAGGATADGWGSDRLDLAGLTHTSFVLKLVTDQIEYGGLVSGPSRIAATGKDGRLDAELEVAALAGGTGSMTLGIDARQTPSRFALGIKTADNDSRKLLPALAGIGWLSGQVSLSAELAGTGDTQQEIFGTLKGTAEITLTDGAVAGLAIPALLGEASQRVVEGWPGSGEAARTAFNALEARFTVADGIAAVDRLSFVSPELNMTARGDIDLLRRALDLRAAPWLVTGSAGGRTAVFPVSMRVEGAWAAPRIYPDLPGILDSPAAAFDTLRTMGRPQQDGATVPDN